MALEPTAGRLSISPTNSGRASPVSRKWASQQGEDGPPIKDKAFRRYSAGVERSLSLFDTNLQDWADYISFLGRLLKSLQAHPPSFATIPAKGIVAKRLAQCLNPNLPGGVHQKALEVYSYIFSMIGKDALSQDLALYLPGLSSTLSFASLATRSPFLDLLETYLLKLNAEALRPALKAIVLALLPGLEDETSEDFERALQILEGFKVAVRGKDGVEITPTHNSGDDYFWQCFLLASITSNSRRSGALAYLTRNLPKLGGSNDRRASVASSTNGSKSGEDDTISDQASLMVTSPEPGLLLRCFASGLADEQILIQRGFLDLLVTHVPLHARVLQTRVKADDLELLMTAATGVVARRDMSLNRRLWTWLLGPEPARGTDGAESPISTNGDPMNNNLYSRTSYFEEFGLQPLTRAILKLILRENVSPVERARPFRICLSLMDRWEIGGLVVPEIFLPVVRSVKQCEIEAKTKGEFAEVLRSASVFFDGVESGLIWGELVGLVFQALSVGKTSITERLNQLSLVKFVIANFNVREEEMLIVHAPTAALTIVSMLQDFQSTSSTAEPDVNVDEATRLAVNIASDLLDLIPERAYIASPSTDPSTIKKSKKDHEKLSRGKIISYAKDFYIRDQGNLDIAQAPFGPLEVYELLARECINYSSKSLDGSISSADIAIKTKLLITLLSKSPANVFPDVQELLASVKSSLTSDTRPPFSTFTSMVSLTITLFSRNMISDIESSTLVDPLVRLAWFYLSPSHPKYHVESARALWHLQLCLGPKNHEIEASICDIIMDSGLSGFSGTRDADPGRRFSILWTHILQESGGNLDRNGSKTPTGLSRRSSLIPSILNAQPVTYEVMLGRPLFLMLDALLDEKSQLFVAIRTWLQTLHGFDKLFNIFVDRLSKFKFLQTVVDADEKASSKTEASDDDLGQCLYYMQKLSSIFRWSSDGIWSAMARHTMSTDRIQQALYKITDQDGDVTLQEFLVHVCLATVNGISAIQGPDCSPLLGQLHRTALSVLHQIMLSPYSSPIGHLHLEHKLIELLESSLSGQDPFLQISLLEVVLVSLKLNVIGPEANLALPVRHKRIKSQDSFQSFKMSMKIDVPPKPLAPPVLLINCLQSAFSSPSSRPVLDSWINFLSEVLPLFSDTIFQVLIPLVETLCQQISQIFETLQNTFKAGGVVANDGSAPESTLIALLNGLEQVLARGHERLVRDEASAPSIKSPDNPQGFFGNMVSGVFSSDAPQTRTMTANNRLTVLLSFQDAVRISFLIWSWGGVGVETSSQDPESAASFNYTSLRMRNRARRLLEHLFAAEALECLETVIEIWQKASIMVDSTQRIAVFNLLHVLDGSRPKHTIPAIFDAIYSRTNPAALDSTRKSTLTSTILDTDIVMFLVEYAKSLEDDAMDEIWTDCMSFMKDILTNPFPHRQTLPSLLEFAAILGEKVDNTNFGEQKKMRRELGDLFLRLLTATFTAKPIGFSDNVVAAEKSTDSDSIDGSRQVGRSADIVGILSTITPSLPVILVDADRVSSATNTLSMSVIGPTIRSKAFPENVTKSFLVLLYQITRLPGNQKYWKKDLADAFNDPRFFSNPPTFLESDWMPLLRQWVLTDKDRMVELLSRLTPPTTAGIVFGVGATSARLEADRRTQLNLRRIATLILAAADDYFMTELVAFEEKITELISASTTSSPSSMTRAEIFMLLRAIVLKISPVHLALLWPTINAELHTAIISVVAADHSQTSDTYNNFSILQACKLLDVLLCIAPDDFQLHEWLFITDTIDAVYRPANHHPSGIIDELAEELGSASMSAVTAPGTLYMDHNISSTKSVGKPMRRPLLGPGGVNCDEVNLERKDELVGKVLRPFFSQLSIFAFERTYEMGLTDWEACRRSLMVDLFDEKGIVKAL